MREEFVVIKHENLVEEHMREIIRLKQQYWDYSYESQKRWIQSCLKADDIHLLMKLDNRFVAYLSVNVINMLVEGKALIGKGLGNVCVDKTFQGQGYGKKIVEKANEIIKENGNIGILLCHTHLIPFYERCGWIDTKYDEMKIAQKDFSEVLMLFNSDLEHISDMVLERNF